jgi:hypothetical protein
MTNAQARAVCAELAKCKADLADALAALEKCRQGKAAAATVRPRIRVVEDMRRTKDGKLRCGLCRRVATRFLGGMPHCGNAHVFKVAKPKPHRTFSVKQD